LLNPFGAEVDINGIPDLGSFLKAVFLMPKSITADFNFPKWHYFGKAPEDKNNLI
jgi:hypothetical protein